MADVDDVVRPLVERLGDERWVRAVTIVGSHASGAAEPDSDVDLFVFVDAADVDAVVERRRAVAAAVADPDAVCVVRQTGHPYADVYRGRGSDLWLDVMFWTTTWAEEELDWRLVRHAPQIGSASTAFWRSIRDGRPMLARDGWLAALRARARSPFPEALRGAILAHDLDLLGTVNPFSFRHQVVKAVGRHDSLAAQDRCAHWLACWFDALFAANRVLHPGEKRLVAFAERECPVVPPGLGADIDDLVVATAACAGDLAARLDAMLASLEEVVAATAP